MLAFCASDVLSILKEVCGSSDIRGSSNISGSSDSIGSSDTAHTTTL